MITRNILDIKGNITGSHDFDDGTGEDQIAATLALYTYVPAAPTPMQLVTAAIQSATDFGNSLTVMYASSNVLQGITQAGKTQLVADYLKPVAYYLQNGSLYAAMNQINVMIADTSDTKNAVSPYVTNDVLYTYLNEIQVYLGVAPTPNPGS